MEFADSAVETFMVGLAAKELDLALPAVLRSLRSRFYTS